MLHQWTVVVSMEEGWLFRSNMGLVLNCNLSYEDLKDLVKLFGSLGSHCLPLAFAFSKQTMIRVVTNLFETKKFKFLLKECPIGQLVNCKIFLKNCMHLVKIKEG